MELVTIVITTDFQILQGIAHLHKNEIIHRYVRLSSLLPPSDSYYFSETSSLIIFSWAWMGASNSQISDFQVFYKICIFLFYKDLLYLANVDGDRSRKTFAGKFSLRIPFFRRDIVQGLHTGWPLR